MKKIYIWVFISLILSSTVCYAKKDESEMTSDRILAMLDDVLKQLPKKLELLKPDMRRVVFYQLRVDREMIDPMVFKTIMGKVEDAILHVGKPTLVFSPELRPVKVSIRDDQLVLASGIRTSEEMRKIGDQLKVDGFLEGDLAITDTLYLTLRIIEAASGAIVWSESIGSSPVMVPEKRIKTVKSDLGVSYCGIPISASPGMAFFYGAEFRASQYSLIGKGLWFSLKGGLLMLAKGIDGEATFISAPGGSMGYSGVYAKASVKWSIIKNRATEDSDWLSVDFNVGEVFPAGASNLVLAGAALQCDLTVNFSLSAGGYYLESKAIKVGGADVTVGGLFYELISIRYWF